MTVFNVMFPCFSHILISVFKFTNFRVFQLTSGINNRFKPNESDSASKRTLGLFTQQKIRADD